MSKIKINKNYIYLLIILAIIIAAAFVYFNFIKTNEQPVITSDEEATKVQQDLGSTVTDIKSDLEQLKKSLGK